LFFVRHLSGCFAEYYGAAPDDEQSLVRRLACANEFDIEGLIVTRSAAEFAEFLSKLRVFDILGQGDDGLPATPAEERANSSRSPRPQRLRETPRPGAPSCIIGASPKMSE